MMSETYPNHEAQQRILDMVARGKVTAAEGESLLAALEQPPPRVLTWRLLYDPFSRLRPIHAWAGALVVNLVGLATALGLGVRYDGLLDMHLGHKGSAGWNAALDLVVAWPVGAASLWATGWLVARRGRLVDYLSGVGLARWPLVLAGLIGPFVFPPPEKMARLADPALGGAPQTAVSHVLELLPGVLVTLPLVVWFVALLVFAFRHGSGLRGGKLAAASVLGLVVGEVVTKVALVLAG